MASTNLGTTLTAQHRLDQLRLRTATVRDLLLLFRLFDPADISGSWATIEPVLVALIQARQPMSAALAARYVTEFRRAEQVAGNASVALAAPLTADDIVPNLRYVGAQNALRLDQLKRPASYVAQTTMTRVEGEVTRQILNGGRTTLVDTVMNDRRCRGYTRVTDGNPCAFCAMLAGRGPVYSSRQDAVNGTVYSEHAGGYRAHGKCGCTGEPLYFTDAPWSPSAAKWDSLYSEAAKAVPRSTPDWSAEVRREFRRRYEATATATT